MRRKKVYRVELLGTLQEANMQASSQLCIYCISCSSYSNYGGEIESYMPVVGRYYIIIRCRYSNYPRRNRYILRTEYCIMIYSALQIRISAAFQSHKIRYIEPSSSHLFSSSFRPTSLSRSAPLRCCSAFFIHTATGCRPPSSVFRLLVGHTQFSRAVIFFFFSFFFSRRL